MADREINDILLACRAVLDAGDPDTKVKAAKDALELSREILKPEFVFDGYHPITPPDRPSRPVEPRLVPVGDLARRRLGSVGGRVALLHALAHIEFNAIDLAFDMAVRFLPEILTLALDGRAFLADWIQVGGEEALHFSMVNERLRELDIYYGALAAHDGLWDAAMQTSDLVIARLAIAPMVLEARGLDVTPGMIRKLRENGDETSAVILERIYCDEIGHVKIGTKWFGSVCAATGCDPVATFRRLVAERFAGPLKEPFNHQGRNQAGLNLAFYEVNQEPVADKRVI